MAVNYFVVTEPCIRCKYVHCVTVCPADCFHEGENFVVIDPEACINCGLCEPECPTEAIYDVHLLPDEYEEYKELNARFSKAWPVVNELKEPMPGADDMSEVDDKRHLLSDKPFEG